MSRQEDIQDDLEYGDETNLLNGDAHQAHSTPTFVQILPLTYEPTELSYQTYALHICLDTQRNNQRARQSFRSLADLYSLISCYGGVISYDSCAKHLGWLSWSRILCSGNHYQLFHDIRSRHSVGCVWTGE